VLHPGLLNMGAGASLPIGGIQENDYHDIKIDDVKNSPYYPKLDVFNMVSEGDRIVLPHFKTRQQRSEYTCGPVAAMMVLEYYLGENTQTEMEVANIMGTNKTNGTTIAGLTKYFEKLGWDVVSSSTKAAPKNYEDFLAWVKQNLRRKNPIIVENVDWGGHYRVIIGYDGMGTKHTGDDVLIMADPFDTTDHYRDGYNVTSAERFFYMWFDHQLFAKNEQNKLYIIAKPK